MLFKFSSLAPWPPSTESEYCRWLPSCRSEVRSHSRGFRPEWGEHSLYHWEVTIRMLCTLNFTPNSSDTPQEFFVMLLTVSYLVPKLSLNLNMLPSSWWHVKLSYIVLYLLYSSPWVRKWLSRWRGCHQNWWPEFDPEDPYGGRKELRVQQIFHWYPHVHLYKHMQTYTVTYR